MPPIGFLEQTAARVCEWMLRFDTRSCIPAINIIFVIFLPTGVCLAFDGE